ncbi:MAG: NAD(P)H-dependent oxidoreductase subunit E [Nitrospira sp.]|nr:NAD(P)H-dependent oxidoreductase subunit E [Nitrospira sp.]
MQIEKMQVDEQIGEIGRILTDQEKKKGIVIHALQQIQADIGYLPEDAVRELSRHLNLSMSEIYSVASFYKMFYFNPRGKKIVKVCLGTACYVRGSKKVLDSLENAFDIKSGETTEDLAMTLETVGCVGCCGLAPVTTINDEVAGEIIGSRKLEGLIRSVRED